VRAVVAAALIAAAAAPAAADEVVTLPKTKAVLHVPAGWTRADGPGLVAGYRGDDGVVAAVTRAQVPNPDAWRDKTRAAYAEQIERGLVAAAGGRRTAKKLGEVSGIPALDLEVKRDTGAVIVVRVLLFRTYALALALEVPAGVDPKQARDLAGRFALPAAP
jgi:hypothetical protein